MSSRLRQLCTDLATALWTRTFRTSRPWQLQQAYTYSKFLEIHSKPRSSGYHKDAKRWLSSFRNSISECTSESPFSIVKDAASLELQANDKILHNITGAVPDGSSSVQEVNQLLVDYRDFQTDLFKSRDQWNSLVAAILSDDRATALQIWKSIFASHPEFTSLRYQDREAAKLQGNIVVTDFTLPLYITTSSQNRLVSLLVISTDKFGIDFLLGIWSLMHNIRCQIDLCVPLINDLASRKMYNASYQLLNVMIKDAVNWQSYNLRTQYIYRICNAIERFCEHCSCYSKSVYVVDLLRSMDAHEHLRLPRSTLYSLVKNIDQRYAAIVFLELRRLNQLKRWSPMFERMLTNMLQTKKGRNIFFELEKTLDIEKFSNKFIFQVIKCFSRTIHRTTVESYFKVLMKTQPKALGLEGLHVLLYASIKFGTMQDAVAIAERFVKSGIMLDYRSYTLLFHGYKMRKMYKEALQIFHLIIHENYALDNIFITDYLHLISKVYSYKRLIAEYIIFFGRYPLAELGLRKYLHDRDIYIYFRSHKIQNFDGTRSVITPTLAAVFIVMRTAFNPIRQPKKLNMLHGRFQRFMMKSHNYPLEYSSRTVERINKWFRLRERELRDHQRLYMRIERSLYSLEAEKKRMRRNKAKSNFTKQGFLTY
ncbi:hypothetical protein V1511DRAFT_510446 [Dipodascopsis uninucleata]